MSTTVTGKLNQAASQFQAGDSTGFGIRIGVQYYDREIKDKAWTNYEAAIFAKAPGQIAFLQQSLVEGAVVEITATSEKVKSFDGQNGQRLSIELLDAKLGFVHSSAQPQQQPQQPRQSAPQRPQQPRPQAQPMDDFEDSDLPFN